MTSSLDEIVSCWGQTNEFIDKEILQLIKEEIDSMEDHDDVTNLVSLTIMFGKIQVFEYIMQGFYKPTKNNILLFIELMNNNRSHTHYEEFVLILKDCMKSSSVKI